MIFDDFITLPWSFDNVLGMLKSIPDLNVYDSHLSCISEKYVTALDVWLHSFAWKERQWN